MEIQRKDFWGIFLTTAALLGTACAIGGAIGLLLFDPDRPELYRAWVVWCAGFTLFFSAVRAHRIQSIAISIPFQDKDKVMDKLNQALRRRGYHLEAKNDHCLVYKARSPFVRVISVEVKQGALVLVGPMETVMKLKKRLWR